MSVLLPVLVLLLASTGSPDSVQAPFQTAEAGLSLLWPTPIFRIRTPATVAAAARLRRAVPLLRAVDPGVYKSNKNSGGWHSSELIGEGAPQLHALVGESGASVTMGAVVALEEAVRGAAHAMLTRMDAARFGVAAASRSHQRLLLSFSLMTDIQSMGRLGTGLLLGLPADHSLGEVTVHIQNTWANVNNQSHFNMMHTHPNSVLSGALYVDTPSQAARLEFADPRPLVQCPRTDAASVREELFMVCAWCPERLCARGEGLNPRVLLDAAEPKVASPEAGLLLLWPSWLPHRVPEQTPNISRVSVSFNVWVERQGSTTTTPSLEPAIIAAQRQATKAFLAVAANVIAPRELEGLVEPEQLEEESLTMHWPTWVQEATITDAGPRIKSVLCRSSREIKVALKSWAKARAVRLAAGDAASDDAGADLFNTDAKLPGELLELRDWVGAVAANVSVKLETRQSYDGHAANCRRVLRVRAVLIRQPPDAEASARRLFEAPAWAKADGAQIAGLFVVSARCKSGGATASPPFTLDLHDPRPEAGVDLAPMDSGRTLRWLPGRGGRGGELLLYPAWMHHALSLPPNPCEQTRTFLSVFVQLSDSDATDGGGGLASDSLRARDLSKIVLDPDPDPD